MVHYLPTDELQYDFIAQKNGLRNIEIPVGFYILFSHFKNKANLKSTIPLSYG